MATEGNVTEKMELQKQVLLSYSVAYPDRHDKIEDLLASVPSNTTIEFISYSLSRKANQFIGEHGFGIWTPWIMKMRSDVKSPIDQYAQQYNLGNYALIDKYAMLLLASRPLTCCNRRSGKLTEDNLSNLFLAYILCCGERLAMNKKLPNNNMKAEEFVESYMPDCLKSNSIEAPRDYRLLMIRCYVLLIEFPEFSTRFAQYIDEFCKEGDIPSTKYCLDRIFLIFLEMGEKDPSNCEMAINESLKNTCHLYNSLTLSPSRYKHDMDFLVTKGKPLIKTGPNIYNFMFMKMFLDRAYTGLLFDMKDALVKRGMLDRIVGYANLRSSLGGEFSGCFLSYSLMKKCFGLNYVSYSGEELEKTLGKGVLDYYLRHRNRIFVFKCKDAQMTARRRLSGDCEAIKKAIFEKHVANSKGRTKGVGQLANVIVEELPSILREINKSALNSVIFVYPVIIYFNDCFDVEGPNYLLNREFQRIISGKRVTADYEVKGVVMVSIEQLIGIEKFFAAEKLDLAYLVNSYIEHKEEFELNQVFPFNKYISQEARKVGYELKKIRGFDEAFENLEMLGRKRL